MINKFIVAPIILENVLKILFFNNTLFVTYPVRLIWSKKSEKYFVFRKLFWLTVVKLFVKTGKIDTDEDDR